MGTAEHILTVRLIQALITGVRTRGWVGATTFLTTWPLYNSTAGFATKWRL